jgi:hypothetical protein
MSISLCIPCIFVDYIDEGLFRTIWNRCRLGSITKISVLNHTTFKGNKYKSVYIYVNHMPDGPNKTALLNGEPIYIVHNPETLQFWKVTLNSRMFGNRPFKSIK